MADFASTTPQRAMGTLDFDPPLSPVPRLAVRNTFSDLLEDLAHLLRVEEDFASGWSFDPAFAFDPDESIHAHATVDAGAAAVLDLAPALPGDRVLQLAAFLVRLAISMEDAMDRSGLHEMIVDARARLMLDAGHPEAEVVNRLLKVAFTRLNRLAALDDTDPPLLPPCDCESSPAQVFCA